MKRLNFPLFLLLSALACEAQDQWVAQTSGTTANLNSLSFPSGGTGYVVGNGGVILKTTNRGSNWSPQTSGTTQPLIGVVFSDKQVDTGYAVGVGGVILKTINGGTTWTPQVSGTAQTLRFVIGKGNLALTGGDSGIILRTLNGGATWSRASTGTTSSLYAICPTQYGGGLSMYAAGVNGVRKSVDSGQTWSALTSLVTTSTLYSVNFDSTTGFATGGSGVIYETTNAGASWSSVTSGTTQQLNSVTFQNYNNSIQNPGYIAGAGGLILKSNTLGATWLAQTSGTTQILNAIDFPHNDSTFSVYAIGNGGVILRNTVSSSLLTHASVNERLGIAGNGRLWYQLPNASRVNAELFDMRGELLWKFGFQQAAGYHEIQLPVRQLSGASLLEFQSDGLHQTVELGN